MNIPDSAEPVIKSLYDYWCEISPPGGLPERQHFDPLDVPKLLPNIWLIDVSREPLRFSLRLLGTRIEEFSGGRWKRFHNQNLHNEGVLARVQSNLAEVVETHEPSWRRGRPLISWEQEFATLERIYLPLARDGETVDMILAITIFSGVETGY